MKAVIFDLDGTMFDTQSVFALAWDYAGEQMGMGKAGYMIHKTQGRSISMSRELWEAEFGFKYNEQELRKHTKSFLAEYYAKHQAPMKNGLYELLEYLKIHQYKIAVASSSPRWEVENHLRKAGILSCFHAVVSGDMVSRSKPDPEIYRITCEQLCECPQDCYALEDSKSGLLAAYHAGCKPIMVPDLWQPDIETQKMLFRKFDNLEEVRAFLSGG